MYRIRFHGRGGQGIKTAGRILGTTFFLEGFEVQDAPLYGADDHCKGCLICVVQCPYHAMTVLPEHRIAGEAAA